MTTFIELREIGESLGRFASVREKAERPQDRIVVQAKNGSLKLIAGDHEKTLIATVGPTDEDGIAIVSSRLLLNSLKALKGKGEVFFTLTKDGAYLKTGFGSSITLDNIDIEVPHFLRPKPFGNGPSVRFEEGWLPSAAKYLDMAIGDFSPFDQVYASVLKDGLWFRSNDNHIGVEVGPLPSEEPIDAHFPAGLFSSLKGLEDAGGFYFPERTDLQSPQVQIGAGKYRVTSVLRPGYGKLPSLPKMAYDVRVTANRKALVAALKSLIGRREYNKVTLAAGASLSISGSQIGKVELEATIEGSGSIILDASLLMKAVQTVDGNTVTIQYSGTSASLIEVGGDTNAAWRLSLAPMKA